MMPGSACTKRIFLCTVTAPKTPATITQARKNAFTEVPAAPIAALASEQSADPIWQVPRLTETAVALPHATEAALRAWAEGLGVSTFVGTSGRVFPTDMKAAPLLRAWLHRLRAQGVRLHMRHRWTGWTQADAHALQFQHQGQTVTVKPRATILALGGASWARLGSDGAWVPELEAHGVAVAPLVPANCGFDVGWSDHFRERFAGALLQTSGARAISDGCTCTGAGHKVRGLPITFATKGTVREARGLTSST
mgnify:CR=1 FL=1